MRATPRFHLLLAAAALSALLAAGVTVLVLVPHAEPPPSPADLLPARSTLLYAEVRAQEDLPVLRGIFPVLRELPDMRDAVAVAVVADAAGKPGWIAFRAAPEGQADPFIVTAVRPELLDLLHADSPLSDAEPFRTLWSQDAIQTQAYATSASQAGFAAGWLRVDTPWNCAIAPRSVRCVTPVSGLHGTQAPSAPRVPGAAFVASAADVRAVLRALGDAGTPALRLVADALLRGKAEDVFGPDVSIEEDLIPLLERDATLILAEGSGGLLAGLTGGAEDSAQAQALLETLERGHRTSGLAAMREHLAFENGHALDAMRATDASVEAREETRDGWMTRFLRRSRTEQPIALARRDRRLVITDAPLLSFLRSFPALPAVDTQQGFGREIAAGSYDPATLTRLLARLFPDASSLPPAPLADLPWTNGLQWSARLEAGRMAVVLEAR